MWAIPFSLWLVLTGLIAWRDLPRIIHYLEKTYDFATMRAEKYAKFIAALIYLPVFGFLALGLWLGETHQFGTFGVCAMWLAGPVWFFLGYSFTGGRRKTDSA